MSKAGRMVLALCLAVCVSLLLVSVALGAPATVTILPSATPDSGGTVSFSVAVQYPAGSYTPGATKTLSVALSPLPFWMTDSKTVTLSAAGTATATFSKTYTVPASSAPGTKVCFKAMALENGANLPISDAVCLTVKGPSGLPDLAIESLYLDMSCNVAVRVVNNGPGMIPDEVWTAHKPESSSVYLSVDGKGWGGATIWGFDPGKQLQMPGGKATYVSTLHVAKSALVKASVDHTSQVNEANEGNNTREVTLFCPDFAAKNIVIKTTPIVAGKPVEFGADIVAVGGGGISYRWELDGALLQETGALFFGGGTQTVSTTWPSATAGQHTIKLTVDSKNQYTEPDETNNVATLTFTVPQPAPQGNKIKDLQSLPDHKPIPQPKR